MTKPLDGIRVVDLTRVIVGPVATMLLADMGADVVKVEPPAGDDTRYLQAEHNPESCPYFIAVNRNKRSIVADITAPEGREIVGRLIAGADVLVHNFRPGIVERLGIDYAAARAIRPDIVYCSISAFGEDGPYARRPGTDVLLQAMGGLMSITGEPNGRPMRAGAPVIDMAAGISAAFAVVSALLRRLRTGEGEYIEGSLFDQAVFLQSPLFSAAALGKRNPERLGNWSPLALVMDLRARDGDLLVSLPSAKFWRLFCEVVGMPELRADARFRSTVSRLANQQSLMELLAPRFRAETVARWVERLVAAGVPCGPVLSYDAVLSDPQLERNRAFIAMDHEVAGPTKVVNFPFRLRHAPVAATRPAPTLGKHTDEILRELGYDTEAIGALRRRGITTPALLREE
ncbi:MAG TPA: CoA transferase [Stellaceae bacterium]|nr:CoA transferase [Stellaceae bacterium]